MGTLINHILDTRNIQISIIYPEICQFIDAGFHNGEHFDLDIHQIHMTLTLYCFLIVINGMGTLLNHISDTKTTKISIIHPEICQFIDSGSHNSGHFDLDLHQIHETLTLYHFLIVINGMGTLTNHILDTKIIQISLL